MLHCEMSQRKIPELFKFFLMQKKISLYYSCPHTVPFCYLSHRNNSLSMYDYWQMHEYIYVHCSRYFYFPNAIQIEIVKLNKISRNYATLSFCRIVEFIIFTKFNKILRLTNYIWNLMNFPNSFFLLNIFKERYHIESFTPLSSRHSQVLVRIPINVQK